MTLSFVLGGGVAGAVALNSQLLLEALLEPPLVGPGVGATGADWGSGDWAQAVLGGVVLGGTVGSLCALPLLPIAMLILRGTDVVRGIRWACLAGWGAAVFSPIGLMLGLFEMVSIVALAVLIALFCHRFDDEAQRQRLPLGRRT